MLKERFANIWARLTKKYRLVVYDHESLSQARTLIMKPLTGGLVLAGGAVIVAILTGILVANVPAFQRGIPGLSMGSSEDYKQLQQKNLELERQVVELDSMIGVFSKAMSAGQPAVNQGNDPMWEPLPEDEGQEAADPESEPVASVEEPVVSPKPSPNPTGANPAPPSKFSLSERMQELYARKQAATSGQPASSSGPMQGTKSPEVFNLIPPVDGYVTMEFNTNDKNHFGMDLVANENSMIRAVANGVVIFSEYSTTTGYVIGIWHSDKNLLSFYKHNSRIFKSVGSYVYAGEAIAVIGNTGINSSGVHLHFELWHDNMPVNPADYIIFN